MLILISITYLCQLNSLTLFTLARVNLHLRIYSLRKLLCPHLLSPRLLLLKPKQKLLIILDKAQVQLINSERHIHFFVHTVMGIMGTDYTLNSTPRVLSMAQVQCTSRTVSFIRSDYTLAPTYLLCSAFLCNCSLIIE